MFIDDNFVFWLNKECKNKLGVSSSDTKQFISKYIYLTYEKTVKDQFVYFGWAKRGRLPNNSQEDTYKQLEVKSDFNSINWVTIQSCAS